ncbi:glycosyltransferase [Castellaniella caeni]|uniref:glycosyltransferase n=1 Tax=Castellaniella caeni TaxID=266123 RepID=UPI000834C862|nr:glycosyltransferase [Castellaniella caeni]
MSSIAQNPLPLVSVCIASYNHQDYIEECIESVLNQTYENVEIIVIDDVSTDDSYALVLDLFKRFADRIRCERNPKNLGVSLTSNRALSLARGQYVALLGSDDRMCADRIARQVQFLESRQEVVACFTAVRVIDAHGETQAALDAVADMFAQPIYNLRKQLFSGNFLNAPSAMVRADVFRQIGWFSPFLLYTQDYDAWLRLLDHGEIHRIDEPLTEYRVHGTNLSFSQQDEAKISKMRLELATCMVRAVEHWPLRVWMDDPAWCADPKICASVYLALAAHLARQDYVSFGKAVFAASKAYTLVIKAAEYDATYGALAKTSLESWILGGEAPYWLKVVAKQGVDVTAFDPAIFERIPGCGEQWSLAQWFIDRTPSVARCRVLGEILDAKEDIETLSAVIYLTDDANYAQVQQTLDSLKAQQHPFSSIALLGAAPPSGLDLQGVWVRQSAHPGPVALNEWLAQTDALPDFVWLFNPGDVLLPHATLLFGEYRLRHPDALAWYADEALLADGQFVNPILKPDCNLDLVRSYPYIGRNCIFSTAALNAVGGLDSAFDDLAPLDFILKLVEQVGPAVLGHIPEVLHASEQALFTWIQASPVVAAFQHVIEAHLQRLNIAASIEASAQPGVQVVRYPVDTRPLVSIIIPTRDLLSVLKVCIESLMEKTAYARYELLLVDNGSVAPDAVNYLVELERMALSQVRVLRWPHPFNFSAINNFAVQQARGSVLLFLNNDIEINDPEWLERLLGHALRPEVGAVGARLDYLDGRVQHAGLVLGMDNSVGFGFRGMDGRQPGYMNRLMATQNMGAVSASCLMMRREVFDELGGFDEQSFPVYYGDADLCLRAGQAGYLVTQASEVRLKHMGGATRLLTEQFKQEALPDAEQEERLYAKWLPKLASDPAYHPAFDRRSPGFNLSPDASRIQVPLPGRPLPVVLASHADWHGCGHYRVLHPYQAMESESRLEGGVKLGNFHFTDIARIQPDTVVLQGAWANEGILEQIRRVREITGAKVVLEFDDYLPNIPTRSADRRTVPQGLIRQMRRAIESVDWIVVSTPTLAHEYADYHADIRVAFNGLPRPIWGDLSGRRQAGKKPRLGWAGGSSHTGDLAEIRALVKDLEDEVDWVFMGMKPEGVRCEFHAGVPIDQYPAKLAALNLDLAVVPLEQNQFNRCKSNLRLLELGVCGVPIICTDIEPYQDGLPVTRVSNCYQDWTAAVREQLADLDALAARGDALRQAVLDGWMLEGAFLDQWARAWISEKNG